MVRVKRGNVAKKRRKKIFSIAKGFRGTHSKLFRMANQQVMKALRYGYVGRKRKKRDFRKLWITRINAAARLYDINYSSLIAKLKLSQISINRKMLAQMVVNDMHFISGKIKTGEGAIGKILIDTAFANNINQGMIHIKNGSKHLEENLEALKHSILLRKYFKKQAKERSGK